MAGLRWNHQNLPYFSCAAHSRAEGSECHGHINDLEDRELQPEATNVSFPQGFQSGEQHVGREGRQEEVGDELEVHLLQSLAAIAGCQVRFKTDRLSLRDCHPLHQEAVHLTTAMAEGDKMNPQFSFLTRGQRLTNSRQNCCYKGCLSLLTTSIGKVQDPPHYQTMQAVELHRYVRLKALWRPEHQQQTPSGSTVRKV